MGATFNNDINVADPQNSTATILGSFGVFTGTFVDVQNYSSVTTTCKSDVASQFSGLQIQWSTTGITADLAPQLFTFDPATGLDGFTVHATVRARYMRVIYQNSFTAQTSFVLTTLLRKGSPTGTVRSVDPTNTFLTNIDVQTVQSILSMVGRASPEQVMLPLADDVNLPGDGPYIFVSPRPMRQDHIARKATAASLASVQLTDFSRERLTFLSITNSVLRGNLYIRLGDDTGLSATTNFDYVVPPGSTWQDLCQFGSVYAGNIYGVWDEVYIQSPTIQAGKALFMAGYYG